MPDQQQAEDREQHAAERTAREVLPALGLRPGLQRPEEHQPEQAEQGQEDRSARMGGRLEHSNRGL